MARRIAFLVYEIQAHDLVVVQCRYHSSDR